MNTEQTFQAANKYLQGRVNVLNNMSSRELSAQLLPEIRAMSFFSARVAEANVLEAIRGISDKYSSGKSNLAEARTEIKQFLFGKGYTPDDVSRQNEPPAGVSLEKWQEAKQLTNIASTARINLILKQNDRMAYAVGQREVSMDPDILERWPYFRYITGPNPRDEHAALDGLVLPKDDPFWHTHTPPWDFNCNCVLEDCDEEEAKKYGGVSKSVKDSQGAFKVDNNGQIVNVEAPESGFVFDVTSLFDVNDLGRLNTPYRASVVDKMTELAGTGKMGRLSFLGAEPNNFEMVRPDLSELGSVMDKMIAPARAAVKVASDKAPADFLSAFPEKSLSLGKLLPELSSSLGIDEVPISLSRGNSGVGIAHEWIHHSDVFLSPGETLRILNETLFNKGARTAMSVIPKKGRKPRMVLALHNPKTKAFSVIEVVNGKGELLSWHRVDEDYTNYEWMLENKKGITQ